MSSVLPRDVDHVFKILLLGDSSVGKSSILLRFTNGYFDANLNSAIGVDFKAKVVQALNKEGKQQKIKLTLWDTGLMSIDVLSSPYISC